jgi:WD40 repeat protein
MRRYVLLVLSILGGSISFSSAQHNEANNPYIYYYAQDLNAFVVERADGKDRRIFGEGLTESVPGTRLVMDGPGWSPSREWFAWTVDYASFIGYRPQLVPRAYVVRADSTQRLTLLDEVDNAKIAWSPKRDLLLMASEEIIVDHIPVAGREEIYYARPFSALIDVETNEFIFEDRQQFRWLGTFMRRIPRGAQWIKDGDYGVLEYFSENRDDALMSETYLQILDETGISVERFYRGVVYGAGLPQYYQTSSPISSEGYILYRDNARSLTVENILTGKHWELITNLGEEPYIYWSPDGMHALVVGDGLSLITISDNAELKPIAIELDEDTRFNPYNDSPIWSPDSQHLILELGSVHHVDTTTAEITRLALPPPRYSTQWTWRYDAQLVLTTPATTSLVKIFDLSQSFLPQAQYQIGTPRYGTSPARLSPDGTILALVGEASIMVDLDTEAKILIPPDADRWLTGYSGDVIWDALSEWVLLEEEASYAEGPPVPYELNIMRKDGTDYRELSRSGTPPAELMLNWLPPEVEVDSIPIASVQITDQPVPVDTLLNGEWTFDLDWRPDGFGLAARDKFDDRVYVWDLFTGSREAPMSLQYGDSRVQWVETSEGRYIVTENTTRVEPSSNLSPDGRWGIERGDGHYWIIYNTSTREEVVRMRDLPYGMGGISYSPDSKWLAIAQDFAEPTQIWSTETWQVVAELPTSTQAVAFSPDGQFLATSRSWYIDIWRVADLLPQE